MKGDKPKWLKDKFDAIAAKLPAWLRDPWHLVPLLSVLVFFAILLGYAKSLSLHEPYWERVAFNETSSAGSAVSQGQKAADPQAKPASPADIAPLAKELPVRFFWAISSVLFAFLCLCIVVVSTRFFIDGFRLNGLGLAISAGCLVIVFATALVLNWGKQTALSGGEATAELLKFVARTPLVDAAGLHLPSPVRKVDALVMILAAFGTTTLIAVACAACSLVYSIRKLEAGVSTASINFEKYASRGVNLLQLTAVALIVGVVEVYFLYLMASYHVPPALLDEVQYFGRGAATATGLIYSGMLAAIFLPLAVEQRAVGRRIVRNLGEGFDAEKKKRLLEFTQNDLIALPVIKAGLVILSPVIVGFLTKQLGNLTGSF